MRFHQPIGNPTLSLERAVLLSLNGNCCGRKINLRRHMGNYASRLHVFLSPFGTDFLMASEIYCVVAGIKREDFVLNPNYFLGRKWSCSTVS